MSYSYCPSCGAEHRAGFTHCADCGVELVDEAPRASEHVPADDSHPGLDAVNPSHVHDRQDWLQHLEPSVLMTIRSELEADMLVGLLRSNEIRAYAQNESSHGLSHYGGQAARSSALARYRIYVHPDDEVEARALIGEPQVHEGASHEVVDREIAGADPLAAPQWRPWVTGVTLFVLLFGILAAVLLIVLEKPF